MPPKQNELTSKRLEKLLQEQKALEARVQKEQSRLRSQQRKDDTRRKIIIGSLILKAAETDTALQAKLQTLLNDIKSDDQRALFDLPPLPSSTSDETDNNHTDGKDFMNIKAKT